MIDGCQNEQARELGALLARYYHQEQALVFDRDERGKASLVSFRANQPLGVIAIMMAQANVSGATVIPHNHDNVVWIVAADAAAAGTGRQPCVRCSMATACTKNPALRSLSATMTVPRPGKSIAPSSPAHRQRCASWTVKCIQNSSMTSAWKQRRRTEHVTWGLSPCARQTQSASRRAAYRQNRLRRAN